MPETERVIINCVWCNQPYDGYMHYLMPGQHYVYCCENCYKKDKKGA